MRHTDTSPEPSSTTIDGRRLKRFSMPPTMSDVVDCFLAPATLPRGVAEKSVIAVSDHAEKQPLKSGSSAPSLILVTDVQSGRPSLAT